MTGKSEIDKYEYGYESTLWRLTKLELGEEIEDADTTDLESPPSSLTPYLSAIRTKPFILLAGISGTGKSRIARRLAQASVTFELQNSESNPLDPASFDSLRWSLQKPENFELIQVKPNWHSSMDVIGYLTNIPSPHYFLTPFVRFIAKAWQHTDVPFFLCLDEMNLAPVEEYFAEFLSAIESRSKDKGGKFQTDPIIPPFESFGADVRKQMVNELFPEVDNDKATEEPLTSIIKRFKSQGLTLPPNLVVIGTVNMDETTFSFSRKVLDRAMSFEMNEVDYDRFLEGCADVVGSPLSDEERKALTDRPIDALEVKDTVDAEKVIDYLKVLNGVLDGTPFKLGYRAANEALLFASAARLFGCDDLLGALDDFTLMKVLSRIEGDSNKLKVGDNGDDKTLLDRLFEVIKGELGDGEEVKCLKKLQRMIVSLERSGFVSYWE